LIISTRINLFTLPFGRNGFHRPVGQPLAPADGRIAKAMHLVVIMVLLLQRHLVRGIALTSFGGR
jgi:ABC-type glycerol-3-phosphate transport system permease component